MEEIFYMRYVTFSIDDALVHVLFLGRVVYFIRPAKLADAPFLRDCLTHQFLLRDSLENRYRHRNNSATYRATYNLQ